MQNEQNRVAKKFKIVVSVLRILGYGTAIISALLAVLFIFIDLLEATLVCLIYAIALAVGTWFACLTYEAIAEGLQLLQDIKNK